MPSIHFLDVTNRDGVQTARTGLSKFGKVAIIEEMTASVAVAREAGAATIGVNAEDGSRTDDGYLLEFALAARDTVILSSVG